jgi:hypothetical protein
MSQDRGTLTGRQAAFFLLAIGVAMLAMLVTVVVLITPEQTPADTNTPAVVNSH